MMLMTSRMRMWMTLICENSDDDDNDSDDVDDDIFRPSLWCVIFHVHASWHYDFDDVEDEDEDDFAL